MARKIDIWKKRQRPISSKSKQNIGKYKNFRVSLNTKKEAAIVKYTERKMQTNDFKGKYVCTSSINLRNNKFWPMRYVAKEYWYTLKFEKNQDSSTKKHWEKREMRLARGAPKVNISI